MRLFALQGCKLELPCKNCLTSQLLLCSRSKEHGDDAVCQHAVEALSFAVLLRGVGTRGCGRPSQQWDHVTHLKQLWTTSSLSITWFEESKCLSDIRDMGNDHAIVRRSCFSGGNSSQMQQGRRCNVTSAEEIEIGSGDPCLSFSASDHVGPRASIAFLRAASRSSAAPPSAAAPRSGAASAAATAKVLLRMAPFASFGPISERQRSEASARRG
eukprot:350958-Chlamydomonas_euryale.AAC.5